MNTQHTCWNGFFHCKASQRAQRLQWQEDTQVVFSFFLYPINVSYSLPVPDKRRENPQNNPHNKYK